VEKKLLDGSEVSRDCPECGSGSKLIVRTNSKDGSQFLGCPNYPGCRYTEPIPQDIRMILAGAQRLPGF
jgi:ssDNA-binding Zn-finger/Zn-ribbon topoisomerase 1